MRRLADAYHSLAIYLFGSKARGDAGPDSDQDLLVVIPHDASIECGCAPMVWRLLRQFSTRPIADLCGLGGSLTHRKFQQLRHIRRGNRLAEKTDPAESHTDGSREGGNAALRYRMQRRACVGNSQLRAKPSARLHRGASVWISAIHGKGFRRGEIADCGRRRQSGIIANERSFSGLEPSRMDKPAGSAWIEPRMER